MRQRRRQLAHRRHPADVGQVLAKPRGFAFRLGARERVGHRLADEPQLVDQLVGPCALRDRRNHEAAEHDPSRPQRQRHERFDVRQLLQP